MREKIVIKVVKKWMFKYHFSFKLLLNIPINLLSQNHFAP